MHIDLNAFFATCEEIKNPELIGKPVIVCSESGRGVVSTASYKAREFGVHSAMPYFEAKRLLKFLDYFLGVGSENLPNNSICREFVGGSCFNV